MKPRHTPALERIGAEYVPLTQTPETPMSRVEFHMCWSRYEWLRQFGVDADVLEIGAGQGLGAPLVASVAKNYVQIDYSFENARSSYISNQLPSICCSAERLPIADDSFDVIAGLEMIYYLRKPEDFLRECFRVLRQNGTLFITMPNPEGVGFHRSPYSTNYFSSLEIVALLERCGFKSTVYPAFQHSRSLLERSVRQLLSLAEKLRLVPRTLAGRQRIKKFLPGGTANFSSIFELDDHYTGLGDGVGHHGDFDVRDWSLLYVVAVRSS